MILDVMFDVLMLMYCSCLEVYADILNFEIILRQNENMMK